MLSLHIKKTNVSEVLSAILKVGLDEGKRYNIVELKLLCE